VVLVAGTTCRRTLQRSSCWPARPAGRRPGRHRPRLETQAASSRDEAEIRHL